MPTFTGPLTYPGPGTYPGDLPLVPTFTAGAPSLTSLGGLSYAVQFLVDQDTRPTWNLFNTATLAVPANTWKNVAFNNTAFDGNGVQHYPGVKIATQGRYAMEACVTVEAGANKDLFVCAFQITGGANNPHLALNAVKYFGYRGNSMSQTGSAVADDAMCVTGISPIALYPGDLVNVVVYLNAAHTLDFNQNTSYIQGRFAVKFGGYWLYFAT